MKAFLNLSLDFASQIGAQRHFLSSLMLDLERVGQLDVTLASIYEI